MYKVGDKMPIRSNPSAPDEHFTIDTATDIYWPFILLGLIGIAHLFAGLFQLRGAKR